VNTRALRWLPPALLLAVALVQHGLVRRDALTPWCGGGFGMFSTNDARVTRHLHAYALSPGLREELAIPPELELRAQAAVALPNERRLFSLARALVPFTSSAELELEAPESIRIDVFATRFDETTLAPSGVLLRSVDWPVAGP
jgi:hypothetical protein